MAFSMRRCSSGRGGFDGVCNDNAASAAMNAVNHAARTPAGLQGVE